MFDTTHLDLNLLKALDALLDERNVTRAAARLGLTQPAMSGILTKLRDNFDDPLFTRAQRGIVPTRRALELAAPVKQVLTDIGALLQPQAFEPSASNSTFCIAATDYALRAIAVPFLAALKRHAPQMRVALVPIDDALVRQQLERGEIDLALMTPDRAPGDLHARRLFDEHYVCVVRTGHPVAKGRRLSLDQFCRLDHAMVSYSGGSFAGVTDEALAQRGKTRRVTVSLKSFLVLPDILRNSDLIAVAPSRLVAGIDGLVTFAPPLDVPGFTKVAAWHERMHRDAAHRWLRELLFSVCAEPSSPPRRSRRATPDGR